MHPNPIFRTAPEQQNLAFARNRAFGMLGINASDGPLLAHVPFLLNADGTSLDLHLVRSNPIARAIPEPTPAVIAVTGPDGYVSPDWYGIEDQVPTWNYVAVHLRGMIRLLPQDDMRDMLDRQSDHFERTLLPKPMWKTAKVAPDILDRMMRQIVPARMTVTAVHGTWKLNQNKPDAVRLAAADHLQAAGLGIESDHLAQLMRTPPQP